MVKTPLYQVAGWDEHFENYRSRAVTKCAYVCVPNKHGGMGLSNVLGEPDGAMIYGIWSLLLQLCSRQMKREGFVTADGKKEGRRLTGEELARAFRRPVLEIYRTLQVVSRPDVGWLELVEGSPEWEQQEVREQIAGERTMPTTVRPPSDHRPTTVEVSEAETPDNKPLNGGVATIVRPSSGYRPTIVEVSKKEGRKEGIEEPLPSPKRGLEEDQEIESDDPLLYAEGKLWLNTLFHRKRHWSYEEEELLSKIVPISRDDKALIDWAYGLSPSHRFQEQTKLKQELTTLLREFNGEIDKIKTVRRRMGLNGAPKSRLVAAMDGTT